MSSLYFFGIAPSLSAILSQARKAVIASGEISAIFGIFFRLSFEYILRLPLPFKLRDPRRRCSSAPWGLLFAQGRENRPDGRESRRRATMLLIPTRADNLIAAHQGGGDLCSGVRAAALKLEVRATIINKAVFMDPPFDFQLPRQDPCQPFYGFANGIAGSGPLPLGVETTRSILRSGTDTNTTLS